MRCCSTSCDKAETCANHITNMCASNGPEVVEDFASFGSVTCGTSGYTVRYFCGPNGNYQLYQSKRSLELVSLVDWIKKGTVTETGDYAKGWNDSIDSVLNYLKNYK